MWWNKTILAWFNQLLVQTLKYFWFLYNFLKKFYERFLSVRFFSRRHKNWFSEFELEDFVASQTRRRRRRRRRISSFPSFDAFLASFLMSWTSLRNDRSSVATSRRLQRLKLAQDRIRLTKQWAVKSGRQLVSGLLHDMSNFARLYSLGLTWL